MEAGGARGGIFSADSYYGFVNVVDRVEEIEETVLMMEEATDEFFIQMKLDGRVQQFVADRMGEYARKIGKEIDPVLEFLRTPTDDEKCAKVFGIVSGYAHTFVEKGKRVKQALADQRRFVDSTTVVSSVNAISNLTLLLNPFMDCEGEAMEEYNSSEALEIEGLEAGLKVVEGGLEILIDSRMNFEMPIRNFVLYLKGIWILFYLL